MEGLAKVGWGGPGGDDLQDSIVLQPGPHHGLEGGAGSGLPGVFRTVKVIQGRVWGFRGSVC